MGNVHIRIFAPSRMIKGTHIHFRHEGNSDVVRTTRDSPLGEGSDCESNMCDRTFRICVGSDGAFGEAEAAIQYIPHLPQKL